VRAADRAPAVTGRGQGRPWPPRSGREDGDGAPSAAILDASPCPAGTEAYQNQKIKQPTARKSGVHKVKLKPRDADWSMEEHKGK
jgi:hypothetical protein